MLLRYYLAVLFGLPLISARKASPFGGLHKQVKVGQTVQTTSGPVSGSAAPNASTVAQYLGIPFGKSTGGSARFLPPERFNGTAPINATSFGFGCPGLANVEPTAAQVESVELGEVGLEVWKIVNMFQAGQSEDCLNLNIWAPSGGKKNKPVLVLAYGGGWILGGNSLPTYDGQVFAEEQDAIVVIPNYRLGIFGYPANPTQAQKNPGILDVRLAIEWVHDNIAAFGGDPDKIVLAGSSAGGGSVDIYNYAYASDPLVSGFIYESGTINLLNATEAKATTGAAAWTTVATAVGCNASNGTTAAADVFTCMQGVDAPTLLGATLAAGVINFQPGPDGVTVFTDYAARAAAGDFARVPVLVGSSQDEGDFFRVTDLLNGVVTPASTYEATTLDSYTCPAGRRANVSLAAGVPTWRYRYFGDFDNTRLAAFAGTWHTSELLALFGVTAQSVPSTERQLDVFEYIRGAWGAFLWDSERGLCEYGWPEYDPEEKTLVRLAYGNSTGLNLGRPEEYDAGCAA